LALVSSENKRASLRLTTGEKMNRYIIAACALYFLAHLIYWAQLGFRIVG
jgi:hypothetical protein